MITQVPCVALWAVVAATSNYIVLAILSALCAVRAAPVARYADKPSHEY